MSKFFEILSRIDIIGAAAIAGHFLSGIGKS